MDLSRFEHLTKRSEFESIPTSLIRRLGFVCVAIVELILNVNFFSYLGESWVMPFAGATLVFMEVWHWISAQSATGIRRVFHYTAWLAICLTSIMAVVSFGQAITTVSSEDSVKIAVQTANQDTVKATLLQSAIADQATYQAQINDITKKLSKLSAWDKQNSERLNEQLTAAKDAKAEADRKVTLYSGITITENGGVQQLAQTTTEKKANQQMNARLIFSQIFTDTWATLAIRVFFIIFGLAMELTLCLSAMPPKKEIHRGRKKGERVNRSNSKIPDMVYRAISQVKQQPMKETPIIKAVKKPEPIVESKPETKQDEHEPEPEQEPEQETISEPEDTHEKMMDTISENLKQIADEMEIKEPEPVKEPEPIKEQVEEEHHSESEASFLFVNDKSELKTLNGDEKQGFIDNITMILNEIKKRGDGELSVKKISELTDLSVDTIRKIFKYFYNRNLLTYDEANKRWRFKLSKDNIINYLRDKTIQY